MQITIAFPRPGPIQEPRNPDSLTYKFLQPVDGGVGLHVTGAVSEVQLKDFAGECDILKVEL